MPQAPAPLARFLGDLEALVAAAPSESALLAAGGDLLGALVAKDDWLPDAYAELDPAHYRQFLLYRDPPDGDRPSRFSVVSFVWGPGHASPVHDHTVWGLIGVLRGAEISQRYTLATDGAPVPVGEPDRLEAGAIEAVSPRVGDIHRVSNAYADRASISIHVYGADIGKVRRSIYRPDGERRLFISGYSNTDACPPFTLNMEDPA